LATGLGQNLQLALVFTSLSIADLRAQATVRRLPVTFRTGARRCSVGLIFTQRFEMVMYHEATRALQDAFGSRELADRLERHVRRSAFTNEDADFIASLRFFFLASANPEGRPDCSFKGGDPGFVRVLTPDLLAFPDYDGNGMFRSLGNIRANPHVGLLFIAMEDKPKRLRVNGTAEVILDDPLLSQFEGAQAVVLVQPLDIFPNCPRNIPQMQVVEPSPYIPRCDVERVEPAWKKFESFADVVPPRRA
jgi:predicted pyridoxine 5'-phosphate oxidase superfamily flavin-nucleotide-binding protein